MLSNKDKKVINKNDQGNPYSQNSLPLPDKYLSDRNTTTYFPLFVCKCDG